MTFRNISYNIDFVYYAFYFVKSSCFSLASMLPSYPTTEVESSVVNEFISSEKEYFNVEEQIYTGDD
jgi:hypothetical protein